ncbi:MAG: PPC domain-containing protein [Chloroflexi bacterium]|nr:PPC domain-containing protein [Chloroflexota bacterium]MCI0580659.1 PPC domain-containing protein [Chloroflexota bacterium]MCI0648675.1 PPC domain-containing protein [Chloroflexota bacterium]MCI0728083.1 PPC domain-containing protein [Chloroflexota bacterium]
MRKINCSWLVLGFLLSLTAACNAPGPEATPTATVRATTNPLPTEPPITAAAPRLTPSRTPPRPTNTPPAARRLPTNWRLFGNERFGLQAAAPQSWVDVGGLFRASAQSSQVGPRLLFLANSRETGERLLAGSGLDEQAGFIFGFATEPAGLGGPSIPVETDPSHILTQFLSQAGATGPTGTPLPAVVPLTINDVPAAYADTSQLPLPLFPLPAQEWRIRVVLLLKLGTEAPAIFLLGAPAENWPAIQETFEAAMATIMLPDSNSNVREHLAGSDQTNGELEKGRRDVWTFNGESGRYATISLTPEDSSIDLTLALIDPSGKVVISADNGFAGDLEALTDVLLVESGTYLIEAGEFFNEAGGYQLSLLLTDEPQFGGGGRIEFGQEITTDLVDNGEHTWVFNGTAGQTVTIILTPLDEQLDLIIEVEGPGGRQLLSLDEGFAGDAEILTGFELSVTGEYTILIRGFAGHGGMYKLSLDEGGESTINFYDAGDLANGDTQREFLREDEIHAWFFEGQVNDEVVIEVTPLGRNMDLDLWLLDPNANQLVTKDEFLSGQAETIEYILPVDGQFMILVREFFGEPGEYEITLRIGGDGVVEPAGNLTYDQMVNGDLAPGRRAGWTFTGQAGDVIDVTLTPVTPGRDLVIVLLDPAGNVAITVDATLGGFPERLVRFVLTSDGPWTIVVQEFFDEGGEYELIVTRQEE